MLIKEQFSLGISGIVRQYQARPFIKWAGGKSQLLSQYDSLFPSTFNRYFEPFLGSAAVFFHLQPRTSFLSDVNAEIINLYRVLQDDVDALLDDLLRHRNTEDYYYQIRASAPNTDVERASRVLYLNKTCFNGLYRENQKGKFNVPFGNYPSPNWRDTALLRQASRLLRDCADIRCASFEWVLEEADSGDFVYFDPPYIPLSLTSSFTSYSATDFGISEHRRLADVVSQLHSRGVFVMLSNSDTSLVREIFNLVGFHFETVQANRAINSVGSRRGKVSEVVVRNYGGPT